MEIADFDAVWVCDPVPVATAVMDAVTVGLAVWNAVDVWVAAAV